MHRMLPVPKYLPRGTRRLENNQEFAGLRFSMRIVKLEMHLLNTRDRHQ